MIRFHDLRHTAASLLLGRDVNPKKVSEMLGHSTVAITLDTYSHVLPTMHREAAKVMDDLLAGPDLDEGLSDQVQAALVEFTPVAEQHASRAEADDTDTEGTRLAGVVADRG